MKSEIIQSASGYRRIKEQRRVEELKNTAPEQLFDVPVSSGFVFKCRTPQLEPYIVSGVLPYGLTEILAKAMQETGKLPGADEAKELANSLSEKEVLQMLIFTRELVRDICVMPRIVENPQSDEEIAPREIIIEDYTDLVKWAMANVGGEEAARLRNFRGKSPLHVKSGTHSKRNRRKSK